MTGKMFRLVGLLLILPTLTPLFSQPCDCVTTGNCPVPINDNGTFRGTLDVTVNGPNDLGTCPLTSVCFSITHTWIGDVSVSLTSPSGEHYLLMADINNGLGGCGTQSDNAEVCIVRGTFKPLSNNTEYICNPGPCSSGTCCLTGDWTVPCNGVVDPITFAQQAPNCDLNDFNIPGKPANGTWTLTVNDICNQDVGTLNNFSLNFSCGTLACTVCEADGGSLNSPPVTSCSGNASLNLNLPPQYSGAAPDTAEYAYAYVITQNYVILEINPTANMSTQPQGTYKVCGLSYRRTASGQLSSLVGMNYNAAVALINSATAPFCANFSSNCVDVTVGAGVPPTTVNRTVCQGECVMVAGQQFCQSGSVTLTSWQGCDSVINVIINSIAPINVNQVVNICEDSCVTINNQQYCPPGPYTIMLTSWQGCDSTVNLTFNEIATTAVITPANPPPLSCANTSVTLDGRSSTPSNSTFNWAGPAGFASTDSVITVSTPGTYTLTVTNDSLSLGCTATTSVTVGGNLPLPGLRVNGLPISVCQGESYDLASLSVTDTNNTLPIITFHSGTPATLANLMPSTVVSPSDTTTYYILGANGACTDEVAVDLAVKSIPVADFSAESPVCRDSVAIVTYTGSSGPGATFNWSFNGGVATPGTGPGPHQVTWSSSGTKTVTLTVTENGCTSQPIVQNVEVEVPLNAPVVNCNPSMGSIEFTWPDVTGATSYQVVVNNGPPGTMTSNNTYLVSGLNASEQVTATITAISGNTCSNSSTQITCTAQDCPPVTVTIDPVADICFDNTTAPFSLSASVSGGAGNGSFTWSGNGITDTAAGLFDPASASTGSNNILLNYTEGVCVYNTSAAINVYPVPTSDFTATSPICESFASLVTYTGNASSAAIRTWDFDGGTATPSTGPGPYSVAWPSAGSYTITLSVEENGCISNVSAQTVVVESPMAIPQINCNSSTSSIEFVWNTIAGATGYNATVLTGQSGVRVNDTTFLVNNLSPADSVTIEVEAIGTGVCGNTINQATCTAMDCPMVSINIDPVAGICRNVSTQPISLTAMVSGGSGNGTLTWSGTGITDPVSGVFDPNAAAPGGNTVTATYQLDNCTFTQSISINVTEQPVSSFSSQSSICLGDKAIITFDGTAQGGAIYTWDFGGGSASPGIGQGPHQVSWPTPGSHTVTLLVENANGCNSQLFSAQITVDTPLVAPSIACSGNSSTAQFNWPAVAGATDYGVNVLFGPPGTQVFPNTYSIGGLMPGDMATIELSVWDSNSVCPPAIANATCFALDCPNIILDIMPVGTLCLGTSSPIQLMATESGGDGSGTGTWSGTGITDAANGIFDPALAGPGSHTITYIFDENGCTFITSIDVVVSTAPTANFTSGSSICLSDTLDLNYAGNANNNATFNWDFDGGTVISGTGPGPYRVHWTAPGNKAVSLTVSENGCSSAAFTQNVQVDDTLAAPVISCVATTSSVEFSWSNVAGASGYGMNVINGQPGTQPTANSYVVNGLTAGSAVTLEVTALSSNSCPPGVARATCSALSCPTINISLAPVNRICFTNFSPQENLQATVGGSDGTGTGSWSGSGVIDTVAGVFDPAISGLGAHTITYTFNEQGCSFTATQQIDVTTPPQADAGQAQTLTCKAGEMTANLGGNSATGTHIIYDWNASFGDFPGDSTVLRPEVSLPGIYTLTVSDTLAGCSATSSVTITASQESLSPNVSIKPISCYGKNDGVISVLSVNGGLEPYLYSLNGSPFVTSNVFPFLPPGVYQLGIMDAAGCENMLTIDIQQPQALNVELMVVAGEDNVIILGDSAMLRANVSIPVDSLDKVLWKPDSVVNCNKCLEAVVHPTQTTTFTVRVEKNGCSDSDEMTIYVNKDRQVYVPTAFSPNDDGFNDLFTLYTGPQAARIKNFAIFDRWGEIMYQRKDFQPNDPSIGWDGTLRQQLMKPATFTWFAQIEFIDGKTEIFEGGVTLIR